MTIDINFNILLKIYQNRASIKINIIHKIDFSMSNNQINMIS